MQTKQFHVIPNTLFPCLPTPSRTSRPLHWCDSNIPLWSRNWDWRQLYFSHHFHPLQQLVERCKLIYFGLGGAPATNDFGASLGEKERFLIPLKSTISLCGGVARKFSLMKIPTIGHGGQCFPIFLWWKTNFFAKEGMTDLAKEWMHHSRWASPQKMFEYSYLKLYNLVYFWSKNLSFTTPTFLSLMSCICPV